MTQTDRLSDSQLKVLNLGTRSFNISTPAIRALWSVKLLCWWQVCMLTDAALLSIPGFGRAALRKIKDDLEPHGLSNGMNLRDHRGQLKGFDTLIYWTALCGTARNPHAAIVLVDVMGMSPADAATFLVVRRETVEQELKMQRRELAKSLPPGMCPVCRKTTRDDLSLRVSDQRFASTTCNHCSWSNY